MNYSDFCAQTNETLLAKYNSGELNADITINLQTENSIELKLIHALALAGRIDLLKNLPRLDFKTLSSDGRNVLHWLIIGSYQANEYEENLVYAEAIDWLVAQGVDINGQDNQKDTALHLTLRGSHFICLHSLIACGADLLPNNLGQTPTDEAVNLELTLKDSSIDLYSSASELLKIQPFLLIKPNWELPSRFSLKTAHALGSMASLAYKGVGEDISDTLNSCSNRIVLTLCKRWGFETTHIVQRLGLRAFVTKRPGLTVVAFRGTKEISNWAANLLACPDILQTGERHTGFSEALNRIWTDLLKFIPYQENDQLWITGHSLGGAMAVLAVDNLLKLDVSPERLCLYTFGQPRVGTKSFQKRFDSIMKHAYGVVRANDIVPTVPFTSTGYCHMGSLRFLDNHGRLYNDTHYHLHDIARTCGLDSSASSMFYQWLQGLKYLEKHRSAEKLAAEETLGSNLASQLSKELIAPHGMRGYLNDLERLILLSDKPCNSKEDTIMSHLELNALLLPLDWLDKKERYKLEEDEAFLVWIYKYLQVGAENPIKLLGEAKEQIEWFWQEQQALLVLGRFIGKAIPIEMEDLSIEASGISYLMQIGLRCAINHAMTKENPSEYLGKLYDALPMGWELRFKDNCYASEFSVSRSPYKSALLLLLKILVNKDIIAEDVYLTLLTHRWRHVCEHGGIDEIKILLNEQLLPLQISPPKFPTDWRPQHLNYYLWHCINEGDLTSVKACLKWGAEINAMSSTGKTALSRAIQANQLEIIDYLLQLRPEMKLVVHSVTDYSLEILLQLMAFRADIDVVSSVGKSILNSAINSFLALESDKFSDPIDQEMALMKIHQLLALGANINMIDTTEKTPLDYANNSPVLQELLLSWGATLASTKSTTLPALPWKGTVYEITSNTLGIITDLTINELRAILTAACPSSLLNETEFYSTVDGELRLAASPEIILKLSNILVGQLTTEVSKDSNKTNMNFSLWSQQTIGEINLLSKSTSPVEILKIEGALRVWTASQETIAYVMEKLPSTLIINKAGKVIQKQLEKPITTLATWQDKLVIGLDNGKIIVQALEGSQIINHGKHTKAVTVLKVQDNTLYSGSIDKTVYVWSLPNMTRIKHWQSHRHTITAIQPLPDQTVVVGDAGGGIKRWSLSKNNPLMTYKFHKKKITGLDYLKTGLVISISEDGTLRQWNPIDSKQSKCISFDLPLQRLFIDSNNDIWVSSDDTTFTVDSLEKVTKQSSYIQEWIQTEAEKLWFYQDQRIKYTTIKASSLSLAQWSGNHLPVFYPELIEIKEDIHKILLHLGIDYSGMENQLAESLQELIEVLAIKAKIAIKDEKIEIVSHKTYGMIALCQALSKRVKTAEPLNDRLRCFYLRQQLMGDKTINSNIILNLIQGMQNLEKVFESPKNKPSLFEGICLRGGQPAVLHILNSVELTVLQQFKSPLVWRPLHLLNCLWQAAKTNNVDLFKRSVLAGASIEACSGSNKTALDYAKELKSDKILAYLTTMEEKKKAENESTHSTQQTFFKPAGKNKAERSLKRSAKSTGKTVDSSVRKIRREKHLYDSANIVLPVQAKDQSSESVKHASP